MKALSIQQPWAMHILRDGKDVENRSWPTPFRGAFLVHAGKRFDSYCIEDGMVSGSGLAVERPKSEFPLGAIVGIAEIVACGHEVSSVWSCYGQYQHVLRNAREFVTPIPYRGQLGYFDAPEFEYRDGVVYFNGAPLGFLKAGKE
jgi:hypothetical protein